MGKGKKHEKKLKKKSKKHSHKEHKSKKFSKSKKEKIIQDVEQPDESFAIPLDLMNSKSHAPETQEEYLKRQSKLRRIVDPVTGRIRVIRGDGEVLEEIVSKKQHDSINKAATEADGNYFAARTVGSKGHIK